MHYAIIIFNIQIKSVVWPMLKKVQPIIWI